MDSQETSPKASQTEKPTSAQGGSASGGNPILWVVLGVVVLAVAGGIWYAVAQSNGSTNAANNTANANTVVNNSNAAANTNADSYAGWKTYTFEGLSFRYPEDWEAEAQPVYASIRFKPAGITYSVEGGEESPVTLFKQNKSFQTQKDNDRNRIVSEESIHGIPSFRSEGGALNGTDVVYDISNDTTLVLQFLSDLTPSSGNTPSSEGLRGTFDLIARSATRQSSTDVDPYAGWKTYRNTKAFTLKLPASWGWLSEYDGAYNSDINDPNIQNTNSVVFGDAQATGIIVVFAYEHETISSILALDPHNKARITDYATPSGLSGKQANYPVGGEFYSYYFQHGITVIEIKVDKNNADTKLILDSLQLQ